MSLIEMPESYLIASGRVVEFQSWRELSAPSSWCDLRDFDKLTWIASWLRYQDLYPNSPHDSYLFNLNPLFKECRGQEARMLAMCKLPI